MDKLYNRPILLTKHQLRRIQAGQMVEVKRKKKVLKVAMKGYTDKRAVLLAKIAKLKEELKKIKWGREKKIT